MSILFFFNCPIFHWTDVPHYFTPSVGELLGHLYFGAVINNAVVNSYLHVFLPEEVFLPLGNKPTTEISESRDYFMFKPLVNDQTVSQKLLHHLPSYQPCGKNLISSLPHQHRPVFLMLALLVQVMGYLSMPDFPVGYKIDSSLCSSYLCSRGVS